MQRVHRPGIHRLLGAPAASAQAERAFEVLAELLVRPLLRDEDIARERDIIVEEIRSYRDDPGQYVFDLFDRTVLRGHPAGLGDRGRRGDRGRSMDGTTSATSGRRGTSPPNLVVAVAGDLLMTTPSS